MATSLTPSVPNSTISPRIDADSAARIPQIDLVRGFAIMGILFVNMLGFSGPYFGSSFPELVASRWPGTLDRVALALIHVAAEGKFLSIFSLLFGVSLVLQSDRFQVRNPNPSRLLRRRLWILLVLGVAHAVLFSWGDILAQYALLGFLLLVFRGRSDRTLLVASGISMVLLVVLTFVVGRPPAWLLQVLSARSLTIYAHGSFASILKQRLLDLAFYYVGFFLSQAYLMFAMMLLGVWAERRHLFELPASGRGRILKAGAIAFGLGSLMSAGFLVSSHFSAGREWLEALSAAFMALTGPLVGIAYICGVLLLQLNRRWAVLLQPLGAVGRLSLSNYILQSVICNLIFYSYGAALYGRVRPAFGLLLSLTIVAIQVPLSVWWLKRFRQGPFEWAWRSLTYRRALPFRVTAFLGATSPRLPLGRTSDHSSDHTPISQSVGE